MKALQLLFIFILNLKLIFCRDILTIRNVLSKRYLTAVDGVITVGSSVTSNDGKSHWYINGDGTIENVSNQLLLQVGAAVVVEGVPIILDNNFNAHQNWKITTLGGSRFFISLSENLELSLTDDPLLGITLKTTIDTNNEKWEIAVISSTK